MIYYQMKKKDIKTTIRNFFFLNPTIKIRVRQIEKKLALPLPSVIRYCKELKKEGILTIAETGGVVFYTADRASEHYLLEKKLFNIRQVHVSGLIDYLKVSLNNPVIILFGSYAKGEDIETSDIDIFIETPSKKGINVEKCERSLQRKIQLIRSDSIKNVSNIHLANNIINGIILNNAIEVFT